MYSNLSDNEISLQINSWLLHKNGSFSVNNKQQSKFNAKLAVSASVLDEAR